jgi:hypothetical protein
LFDERSVHAIELASSVQAGQRGAAAVSGTVALDGAERPAFFEGPGVGLAASGGACTTT